VTVGVGEVVGVGVAEGLAPIERLGVVVTVPVEVGEGVVVRELEELRVPDRVGVGMGTPKSAKWSIAMVPVPVAEPKQALIHTEGRLSRMPVVAGTSAFGQF